MWKKLTFVVPVLLLLGGCAGLAENALGLPNGVLTQSVQNPIKKSDLYRLENGLSAGVAALQTYKNYCEGQPVGDRCDAVVATAQKYIARARPLLRSLRTFVRKNDQVNAKVVFTTVQGLIAEFRGFATQNGIPLPVTP
jgi:hypothetical protein